MKRENCQDCPNNFVEKYGDEDGGNDEAFKKWEETIIKIAEGYGISAKRVSEREGLQEAVQEMIQSDSSFLLEVVIEKEDNVFPMVPTGASVSEVMLEPQKK